MAEHPDSLELLAALAQLTPRQREALVDHDVLGITFPELDRREGLTGHTSSWQLADKARRKVRRIIEAAP